MKVKTRRSFWQRIGDLYAILGRLRIGEGARTQGLALFSGMEAPLPDETELLETHDKAAHYPKLSRRWRGGQVHQISASAAPKTSTVR